MAAIRGSDSFLIELCKISTAANSMGVWLHWHRGAAAQGLSPFQPRSRPDPGGYTLLQIYVVCLLSVRQAKWDWPRVHCKHGPLREDRAGGQGFLKKHRLPPALTRPSNGSYTDSSVQFLPHPLPMRLSPIGTHTWDSLIKHLRSWRLISFAPWRKSSASDSI